MTRRVPRLFSAIAAIGLAFGMLAVATPAQAGVDDFTFESLDVQYYLDRDDSGHSTLRTVETFVAVFPQIDQNRGLVRDIPSTYGGTDPRDPRRVDTQLHIESVTDENGDPVFWETYDAGSGFFGMYLDDDTYKHGRTTYVIEYTQKDVTRHFDDTGVDEFYWDVNGTGWPQPFGEVTATVHLGSGLGSATNGNVACYWGSLGSDEPCTIEATDDGFRATQTDLGARQNVTVAIGFESGTFALGQTMSEHWIVRILPWVLLGGLGAIALAIVILRTAVWRHAPGRGIVVPQYEGPEDLGVMPAAAFLGQPKRGFAAQLVNFAVLGIARLIEDPEQPIRKRYRLELLDRDKAVQQDDNAAVRKLFSKGTASATLLLDQRNRSLGDQIASLVGRAATQPKLRRLIAQGKSPMTKVLRWVAFACFIGGWFVLFWADDAGVTSDLIIIQSIALILGSLIATGFGGVPVRRTQKGSETLEHLQGLRDYLRLAETERLRVLQSPEGAQRTRIDPSDDDAVIKLYEKLLPWAMVWGIEKDWQDVLGKRYAETQTEPTNLQFIGGLSGLSGFSTTAVSSGFAQTVTTSSYSSSGGGSSFSGGSSGGGFSGGGGGGGGGGGR